MIKIKIIDAMVIPDQIPDFDHNAILFVYQVGAYQIRAIHWSGRFDGDVEHLVNHLYELARKYHAHYLTTTETQQKNALTRIKERFGKKWGVQKSGEYVVIFDKAHFEPIPWLHPHVVVATHIRNWLLWRQMHVGYFNLRLTAGGRRFRIMVVHGPSGIEKGDDFKPGKQSDIAHQGWLRLGRSNRRFAKLHPFVVQVVTADSNGDHHRPFWLHWFEDQLGANSVWAGRVPAKGTHGSRLIDGAWIYSAK